MTTVYFGEYWNVPALVNADQAPTPVGTPCMWCEHEIQEGERGYLRAAIGADHNLRMLPAHRGCDFASTSGHMFGVCSCTGFDDYWDRNVELERRGIFG